MSIRSGVLLCVAKILPLTHQTYFLLYGSLRFKISGKESGSIGTVGCILKDEDQKFHLAVDVQPGWLESANGNMVG